MMNCTSPMGFTDETAKIRGEGVSFDRIRRITGYLVGTLDRFNSGKAAEEHDRVKHGASKLDEIEATAEHEMSVMDKYVYAQ